MDVIETACVIALLLRARSKRRRRRRYWVHPISSQRLLKGQFYKLYEDLCEHPREFFRYYRMSKTSFEDVLKMIGPKITYQNTRWRKAVPPEERLSVTLRYLATGNSFYSLHFEYLLGATTIREIVSDTCIQLWKCLQPLYMPEKSQEDWRNIAQQFLYRTDFPNCVGAVDGKHIRMQKPPNSGSVFYNYKNFFSMILLGIADADYCFTAIDVGAYGANSDSNVLKNSNIGQRLKADQLNIPKAEPLPNDHDGKPMPFVIVGDEAFALSKDILRPYPRKKLTVKQRVFNYRLCRARRMVECAFGIMANKWRIFHRPLDVTPTFADNIVKTCCVLHNFVRKKDGIRVEDESYECPLEGINLTGVRADTNGIEVRDYFPDYFISPQGSVPWQYDRI